MPELVLDYEASKFWLEFAKVIGGVVTFLIGMWLIFWRGRKDAFEGLDTKIAANKEEADKKFEALQKEQASTESKVSALKAEVESLPNHAEVGRMFERMDALHGGQRELVGEMKALSSNFQTMHAHLLSRET